MSGTRRQVSLCIEGGEKGLDRWFQQACQGTAAIQILSCDDDDDDDDPEATIQTVRIQI
jgi:hypothetical protein